MLYFSDSVLKTLPSTRRISRRITLSRVVELPMKEIRLTKNCLPSDSLIVTSTVGFTPTDPFEPFEPLDAFDGFDGFEAVAGGVLPSVGTGARPSFFGFRSGYPVNSM